MAATVETIEDCVKRRLGMTEMLRLVDAHGLDTVRDALSMTGSCYAGCEEIGSSDVTAFVETFKRFLGSNPAPRCDECGTTFDTTEALWAHACQ